MWLDEGGALRVGPESARAEPGPACYGRGGTRATVTDANLLLGRLPTALPGGIELDVAAAERALEGIDAAGVIDVVNAEMVRALRVVSVEQGLDPRDFALVAFGGAGPLHACALADELGMTSCSRSRMPPEPCPRSASLPPTSDGTPCARTSLRSPTQASFPTSARRTCGTPGSRSS